MLEAKQLGDGSKKSKKRKKRGAQWTVGQGQPIRCWNLPSLILGGQNGSKINAGVCSAKYENNGQNGWECYADRRVAGHNPLMSRGHNNKTVMPALFLFLFHVSCHSFY